MTDKKLKNENVRAPQEYRLVTDGKELYRLAPSFDIPEGVKEVFTHEGKKVYQSNGKLMPKFMAVQRIQPRLNLSKVTIAVRQALGIYSNNG